MTPPPPDPDDPLLDRLREALRGKYAVERRLGAGGMGYVYVGRDPALDLPVAIKVLRPELATARAAERFVTEARALAAVRHQNVVTIYPLPQDTHGLYLYVMELLGETLADRLRQGPLKPREAVRLGMDLLAGLERVHQAGIVHRDIKPANIFLQEHGPAKIGDFGIAHVSRPSGDHLTDTGVAPGTPVYMAPEQYGLGEASPASDLYSIAMVIYEAMTARRWKTGTDPTRGDWRGVPRRVRHVLYRALEIDPAARWPDARTFRHALAVTLRQRAATGVAIVAAALATATGFAWWLYVTRHDHAVESEVAVLPFEVTGGPADIGEHLGIVVQKNLENAWRDSGFRVTPENHSAPWAVRLSDTAELPSHAWDALHAEHIVRGRVTIRRDSVEVAAEVLPRRGGARVLGRVAGSVLDYTDVGRRLALNVVRVIDPSGASQFEGWRVGSSVTATDAFVRGEHAFVRDNWAAAEVYFREAIAADSAFADAWWGLYKVQSWRRSIHEVDLDAVYRQNATKFGDLDRLLIQAELAPTTASRIGWYRAAIDRAPYDAYPRLMLGNELFHRGGLVGSGFAAAIEQLDSAVATNPYLAATYSMLAWAHIRLGNAAQAQEALDRYATHGRPQPEEDFSMLDVLRLAWGARFAPEEFSKGLDETLLSAGGVPSLARAVRLGLAFGIPAAQEAIGHALEAADDDALRVLGLTAQVPPLLSKGRMTEALAHLNETARVSGDQEYAFLEAQLALVLPAIGVPGVLPDARLAARTQMQSWAAAGSRVVRARWTLLLDAIASDTASIDRILADLTESPDAPALADLGAAMVHALRGDTAGALRLSDSLTLHVVAAQVADPLQRAVLFLSRGRWLAGSDPASADSAWRWYENADFVGWPQGWLQAAELDGALETYARYLRAGLAHAARDSRRVCELAPEAVARWAHADPGYAPLHASLLVWTQGCER